MSPFAMSTEPTPAPVPATLPAFNAGAAFGAFVDLALSRSAVRLESANYSDAASYRSDRRRIEKQTKRLRAALDAFGAWFRPYDQPDDVQRKEERRERAAWQLMASACGERFSFDPARLAWEYCAGQYKPTEIRAQAACVAESAARNMEPVKDYAGARYHVQRLGWLMKSAGRRFNETLKGISRNPTGYYSPQFTRKRLACLASFCAVLSEQIAGDAARALGRVDAPAHDPDGLRFIMSAAAKLSKDTAHAAHLATDPLPDWAPGALLYDKARQLYPDPEAADLGIYS